MKPQILELMYAASEAIGFLEGISIELDESRGASALTIARRLKIANQALLPEQKQGEV